MRILLLLCLATLTTALLAPVASADPARGAVFSGTGVWIDIWDAYEKAPDKVVAIAQQQGVSVIYVETANAKSKVDVVNRTAEYNNSEEDDEDDRWSDDYVELDPSDYSDLISAFDLATISSRS